MVISSLIVAIFMAYIDEIGFGKDNVVVVIGTALTLTFVSLLTSTVPVGIYWLVARKKYPGTVIIIWCVWLILAILNILDNYYYTKLLV